ncbi:pitrilysin family protein [Psychroserpens sp.]|uniref:M16 family metallopeptidase n=1 Tax=Psychroserpens sp. TaxID=2020870 RepID=UPI001AFF067F|nr:pitrilysin family protein [Psychroserpens sp.]MBO6605239.1 insulinase family protein [Psychroserpens sp.]MBO6630287.1 insulinase family protein [Psychroserpens sp.]MBO6653952.1 insulinase family protein [Psychroserpens sp.]MBO6682273.1 insulinase family protein [Psychroserpens sp.]MBO6748613.1 insulinase family protein [Psychroserpens sp.]
MKLNISIFVLTLLMSVSAFAQIDRSKMPEPGPAPTISLDKPEEFTLKNGMTVMVVENRKLPRVSYSLTIDNKPMAAGDKSGIESILASMLGDGTTNIPKDEFNEEVDFLGANIGFSSSGGFASCLSKYKDRIVELMADAAINPLFTQEEFEKQKDQLIQGLKTQEKSVDAVAGRVGSALAYGKEHPYGEFTTEETVNNIEFSDIDAYYKKRFNPNNAYMVIVGDIDVKTAKKQMKKYFGSWEKGPEMEITVPEESANVASTQINFVDMPNAVQSNISLTNNVDLEMKDDDYHSVLIANKILGGGFNSYLNMNLREEHGYTYGARSSIGMDEYASRFRAGAAVRNMVTDSAVVETLKEINRIKTETVEQDMLKNAKAKYVGDFVLALESPQTIARYALNIKLNDLPEDFYTTYLQKINAVTADDVKRVANKYFKTENARFVVVGKGSEVLENLVKTGIPVKYFDAYANETEKPEYEIEMPADMDANKVLNAYIEAIGGRETLDKVNSVYMTAEAELQPGMMMNLEMKKTTKQQSMQEVTAMGQSVMKSVVDGKSGYRVMQGQRQDLNDDELKEALEESSPFPEVNYLSQGVTLEKIEMVDGEKAYKIVVDEKTSIYYSVETGLKIKEVNTTPAGSQSAFYTDYQEVAGIKFPFTIGQTMGPRRFDFKIKEIKVNEGVSDADFD